MRSPSAGSPARAKLVRVSLGQRLRSYGWSSFPAYVGRRRPKWLEVERVLRATGAGLDDRMGRRRSVEGILGATCRRLSDKGTAFFCLILRYGLFEATSRERQYRRGIPALLEVWRMVRAA